MTDEQRAYQAEAATTAEELALDGEPTTMEAELVKLGRCHEEALLLLKATLDPLDQEGMELYKIIALAVRDADTDLKRIASTTKPEQPEQLP